MRGAAVDFYFNSWRLVPANLIWGVLLLALLGAAVWIWLPILVLVGALGIPIAGMHRVAALISRGDSVGFADFLSGMRRYFLPALGLGTVAWLLALVFTANAFIGLQQDNVVGWLFSAFALYGDVGLVMYVLAAWPILVDPLREELPVRRRLWLAAAVIITRPVRMLMLTAVIVALLLASTLLFAALLTISVAYVSLVATRYVLPAADRLEGRPTVHLAD